MIYGSYESSYFECVLTHQGQSICSVESRIRSGSLWFGEGSHLAHRRIARRIQGCPWVASGSPLGAEREHPWIVYLRKTIKNPPRFGCRVPYDVDKGHRLILEEADQSELNYDVKRSGVDRLAPGGGLGELGAVQSDPYLDPWVSEAIRFGF